MTRTFIRLAMLVASSTLLTAANCDPVAPAWDDTSDFEVRVGSADNGEFYRVDDGTPFVLDLGFQGGQHINVSVAAAGVRDEDDIRAVVWVLDAETEDVLAEQETSFYFSREMPELDGMLVSYPTNVVFDNPSDVLGRNVLVRVQLMLDSGDIGRGTNEGVVDWSEYGSSVMEGEPGVEPECCG